MLVTTCLTTILGLACDTDLSCEKIKPCRCYGSPSRLLVDCHDTNLNTTEICKLCQKVQNITSLDLSKNGLSDIPSRCFQECYSLLQLSLASNNLSWLKTDTFLGLSKLMHLNLINNKLINKNGEISDPNFFKPFKNLETLKIGRNVNELNATAKFVYLANVAGNTLSKLRKLALDGLPNAVFDDKFLDLQYLKQIDFSGDASFCNITSLTNKSFENVPYVTHLNLSRCNLATIEAGTFEPLRLLTNLNLSHNMALGFYTLRNVAYGLQFTNIDELDYSKVYKTFGLTVQINRCDVWFLHNTTLRTLWLNSNRMASAETDAFRLLPRSLEVLHVEDNNLSVAPYILQLGCLINLKRLELNRQETSHCIRNYNNEMLIRENTKDSSGGCYTHNLPINKTMCPWKFTVPTTLQTVNFRASSLRSYPLITYSFPADTDVAVVPHTKSLQSLDVSNNILYFWDTFPIEAEHLENLTLSDNFCTNISHGFFGHFRNLLTLDVSNNKLGPLLENDTEDSTFKYLQKVKHLNLSNNWIGYLPTKVFNNIPTVETLDLSFNRLTKINFGFEGLRELAQLYLQQNEISTLPLGLLEHFEDYSNNNQRNKISIDLSNNPSTQHATIWSLLNGWYNILNIFTI